VGLKHVFRFPEAQANNNLNRTSVGLKRRLRRLGGRVPATEPQSNQRGIETASGGSDCRRAGARLNRTSVGLKQARGNTPSNREQRLNRTSVGLKRARTTTRRMLLGGLNRASVGLKQCMKLNKNQDYEEASIEPAWD